MKKLAIVTSHPIQYNAPLFRLLAQRNNIYVKVFYTWGQTKDGIVYDPDFKREFKWDIPLLEGYEAEFIENISHKPSAGSFNGIENRDLIQQIEKYKPNALLVYGWSFKSHLNVLRHFKGKTKILFRGDSTLLDEGAGFSLRKMARRIFLKWVYQHIDIALYTGEANKAYFKKHGLSTIQLVHAPHAVENERFFDSTGEHEKNAKAWRKELHIPDEAIVFLFAGKLETKKDPALLIQAFKSIAAPDSRLVIVGNGLLETTLKATAADDKRIIFLAFQNQQTMPIVYRLGNIFVLPSRGPGETWGLSVNEAMACGKPIIVSNRCGCAKDLVKENGFVIQAKYPAELSNKINYFIKNPDMIHEMGQCSKKIISDYSLESVAKSIEMAV